MPSSDIPPKKSQLPLATMQDLINAMVGGSKQQEKMKDFNKTFNTNYSRLDKNNRNDSPNDCVSSIV